jgi:hypothetical protein
MSDQAQRIAEIQQRYSTGRYIWNDHSGLAHDGDYDVNWLLDALAASEARCRALEQDMEALRGMADAERGEWRRDLLEAEARCRALQAQIEQQEAQK